ncbi:MAG: CRTAC1 family protein [Planctomycetota bacterium]|jgi:hypothetical protein
MSRSTLIGAGVIVLLSAAVFVGSFQFAKWRRSRPSTPEAPTPRLPESPEAPNADDTTLGANLDAGAEFRVIAEGLLASANPYIGRGRGERVAARLAGLTAAPVNEQVDTAVLAALEHAKAGELEAAAAMAERGFEIVEASGGSADDLPHLYRARGLVNLRRAELANCVTRHNADCCIFPLAGGGVHTDKSYAQLAFDDYVAYLGHFPSDLNIRWLLNVSAMALGTWPEAVPAELRIPPRAFRPESRVGRFADVATAAGVDTFNLCGGAIVDDLNGDGLLDIATSSFDVEGPLTIYHSAGDGTFTDVSSPAGATAQLGGLNCIGGDYDGDGDIDLFVMRGAWLFDDGQIRNSLLRNDNGAFTDVTRAAGLAEPAMPTQAATWFDADNDGDLDLLVGNEGRPDDAPRGQYPTQLFMNQGDGTFEDVARAAGIDNKHMVKGVTAGDYDNDGDVDVYLSNIGPNRLYANNGDGTFEEVTEAAGVEGPGRGFATWFFDYDNDGWLDLFAVAYEAGLGAVCADHLGLEFQAARSALYRNNGDGTFTDVAMDAGLNHAWLPMGANFGDVDNDGWLDVYLATGEPALESLMPNVMLRNDGGERFLNVTTDGGFGHLQKGHGVAFADLDNDGDQDVYHQLGGFYAGDAFKNALFENPGHGNRFVTLDLRGQASPSRGTGTRVAIEVETPSGPRTIHRAVGSVSSFGGSPSRLEVGLGDATAITRVTIDWPRSPEPQVLEEVPLDSFLRVVEGMPGFSSIGPARLDLGGSAG